MNKTIEKENLFNNFQSYCKKNYKLIIIFLILVILIVGAIQFYSFYLNNKILSTSIKYNSIKSNSSIDLMIEEIDIISNEKNFYGILSDLDIIKIKLDNKEFDSAYNDYITLLDKKNLNNLYKTSIAIKAAYSLIDSIEINSFNEKDIKSKIQNLFEYIDLTLTAYEGYRLEILFLLSMMTYNQNNIESSYEEVKKLYKEIQENDKISVTLKERVKKIYDFQQYN
tara:strand:- start:62 stop:736 length:675 start_codon:yes stop_codon:yes gene_type:complete